MKTFWACAVYLMACGFAWAGPEALLVPPTDLAQAGKPLRLTLFLNNPTNGALEFALPVTMEAEVVSAHEQRTLAITPIESQLGSTIAVGAMSFTRIAIEVMLPDTMDGTVSLRINDPESNAVMFSVTPARSVQTSPGAIQAAEAAAVTKPHDLDLTSEREKVRGHISAYDPIYLAVGFHEKTTAKFQFSFKYRLFAAAGNVSEWWRELYFGYTQTSLWDLSEPSLPFYDTSYKPGVFYFRESFALKPDWLTRLGLQAGLQHESNGSAGDVSRSLNTAFLTPMFTRALSRSWSVMVAPRLIAYVEKSENPRIPEYRGNMELLLRVRQSQGMEFAAYIRKGNDSRYGSVQFDFTWPLRAFPGVSSTIGGNLLFQYFNGWGESLRDYDVRRPDQVRLGFNLVR